MKIVDILEDKIDRFPKGYIFTYAEFDIEVKRNGETNNGACPIATGIKTTIWNTPLYYQELCVYIKFSAPHKK